MGPVVLPWLLALRRASPARGSGGIFPFGLGYGLAWTSFCLAAALLQGFMARLGLGLPLLEEAKVAGGVGLVLVGGYQFTRLKEACLSHCRSPMGYLMSHWRSGWTGALRMGLGHGLFCLGCCWALMLLALVVGHLSLVWMGVLALVMLMETGLPHGRRIVRPLGAILVLAGLAAMVP